MAERRRAHGRRLDQIEEVLTPVFVEIEALRLLFGVLLEIDFERAIATDADPVMLEMLDRLEAMLGQIDPDTEDVAEQIRMAALAAAIVVADRGEDVEIEMDDGQEPANDD